jgi:hypothetical protein
VLKNHIIADGKVQESRRSMLPKRGHIHPVTPSKNFEHVAKNFEHFFGKGKKDRGRRAVGTHNIHF